MQNVVAEWFVTGLGMAVWGVPFLGFLFWLSKNYLTSYTSKKGENLATKEDIRDITKEVEAAKEDFSHRLENLKTHNSLAMVAAEKRLSVHQELFNHWRSISLSVTCGITEDMERFTIDGEQWLYENFVYVDGEAREAFLSATDYIYKWSASIGSSSKGDNKLEAEKMLLSAQASILRAVSLPKMSAESFKNMAKVKVSPA
ncbi:hypothetical protein ACF8PL_19025 [Delftia sp. WSY_4]|uniref:hypothetical protein n=1 Tax=unclassified Delftia TaxID=2613839 RepID=UPI00370B1549